MRTIEKNLIESCMHRKITVIDIKEGYLFNINITYKQANICNLPIDVFAQA